MKKILWGLLLVFVAGVALVGIAVGVAWVRSAPEELPAGTESASRLLPGPQGVGTAEFNWVDRSRPTPENGVFPGADERSLPTSLWFPEGQSLDHPLVVFSHGLMSARFGGSHMAEHLASHGYVVVAADYPLSNGRAPGGATYLDLVNQPRDVSFLIDQVLDLGAAAPFEGAIDEGRIGVFGISLGGATSTLAAFHPEWRDPRVAVAISIAGPADIFGAEFFGNADIPFLMIGSTSDAIVDYETNALPIPGRIARGGLLTLDGASHAGYTRITSGWLRVLGNPDNLGCRALSLDSAPQDQSVFVDLLGTADQGLIVPDRFQPPCSKSWKTAMAARRQQEIATLAVQAFFESHFASSEEERAENRVFVERTLSRELPEVSFDGARLRR